MTANSLSIRIAIEALFSVDYVGFAHFVLHPQLISCIYACRIVNKCFQTTFSPSVPY